MAADPGLRELAISGSEDELGFEFTPEPWAVILETGFPEGSYTLVALADGSASLYFSSGGGIIGAGEHPTVATASKALVGVATQHAKSFTAIPDLLPPPKEGFVSIYIRQGTALLHISVEESELGEGDHPQAEIFYAAHELIHEMRVAENAGA